VAWASFERKSFSLIAGELRWYRSSPRARRGFCGTCGCSMFFESADTPHEIDVAVAILDNANDLPPQMHIWAPSRLDWVRVDDGLAVHREDSQSPLVSAAAAPNSSR
jgi:hypothetical protein